MKLNIMIIIYERISEDLKQLQSDSEKYNDVQL